MTELIESLKQIGIVTQIINDENILFIINNNIKCAIGNIVALKANFEEYALAEINKIDIDFYLENSRQYFVSKAVDNNINKINELGNQPRYGQYITAKILGYYSLTPDGVFKEIKSKINRYTPYIFQPVYLVNFDYIHDVYGLINKYNHNSSTLFSLGSLVFPTTSNSESYTSNIEYSLDVFTKHTLITGVTGSGKSRLAALIIKNLASVGAHINILDPHNEYSDLLIKDKHYHLNIINQNNISFSESNLTPDALSKLLPTLTPQQEEVIFDCFNSYDNANINLQKIIERLIEELILEFTNQKKDIKKIRFDLGEREHSSKNYVEYVSSLVNYFRGDGIERRPNKADVFIAVINKLNELRIAGLMSYLEPNWLKESPFSIDVFNIDYSLNDSIRRFINSIIQYLLRKKNKEEHRILVIDEAHMLLNEGSQTTNLLKRLLREARKFNITVVFVSQNINDIPIDIVDLFQNQFKFRQKNVELTSYFPDQICNVTLYGSKLDFTMRVDDILSSSDS